jgi:hypothetical protein
MGDGEPGPAVRRVLGIPRLAAAAAGGTAGGLLPRRAATSPSITDGNARPAGLEAATNANIRRPTGVVAS